MNPNDLTLARARLVAREQELTLLHQAFESGECLVTVCGIPGIGKTALAKAYAANFASDVDQLLLWIDPSSALETEQLVLRIAELDNVVRTYSPRVRMHRHEAAGSHPLCIIDDFERCGLDAATLAQLTLRAPRVRFLVTTRSRLHIAEEHVLELGPLSTSPRGKQPSAGHTFLLQCVQRLAPAFEPTASETRAMVQLVRELDGIPLALELAASRVAALGADNACKLLARCLELTSDPSRAKTFRAASMREALDASWDSLDDDEKRLLAACAVFRGGFSLEALEAVASRDHGRSFLDVVQALRDRSLIVTDRNASTHTLLGIYSVVRAYAAERLEVHPERDAFVQRHREYYLARGVRMADDDLDGEYENLVAIVGDTDRATVEMLPAATAARIFLALGRLQLRGDGEGGLLVPLEDTERAIALAQVAQDTKLELFARTERARGLHVREEFQASCDECEKALELARQLGDTQGEGVALYVLASNLQPLQRYSEALFALEESVALHRRNGSPKLEAVSLAALGATLCNLGRYDRARSTLQAALSIDGRCYRSDICALIGLAMIERLTGNFAEASELYAKAVSDLHRLPPWYRARVLAAYGAYQLELGHNAEAMDSLECAYASFSVLGPSRYRALCAAYRALLLARQGHCDELAAATAKVRVARCLLAEHDPFGIAVDLLLRVSEHGHLTDAEIAQAEDAAARSYVVRLALRVARQQPSHSVVEPISGHVTVPLAAESATCVTDQSAAAALSDADVLRVEAQGMFFLPPNGTAVPCHTRTTVQRLLRALAKWRIDSPGSPIGANTLVQAGWCDEKIAPQAARNRLRVALSWMRKRGLGQILVTQSNGYFLDPRVKIEIVHSGTWAA